jgi:hypothetical protein
LPFGSVSRTELRRTTCCSRRTAPAGSDSWQPPVVLGDDAYWKPEVAFDSAGDATAAWISRPGAVLMSATRSAASGRWSDPLRLSPPGEWVYGPLELGVDAAGDAVVVASFGEVSYRPANGIWQAATQPIRVAGWSLAVASDGSMLLAGVDIASYSVSVVGGYRGAWTGPIVLGKSNRYAAPATAIAPGGNAVVAWGTNEHGNNIVYAATRIVGLWLPATPVSFLDGNADNPAVRIDDRSDMLDIWDATVDPEASFWPIGIDAWQRPVAVAPPIQYTRPTLAMNGHGQAVAAWTTYGANAPVETAYFTADAGWQATQTIATQGDHSISSSVPVAIDPYGDAVAVWQHYESTEAGNALASIQSAVLDNDGPLLHAVYNHVRPRISCNARVGRRLRCTTGSWSGEAPIRFTFRWLRGSHTVGPARMYRFARTDVGRSLACRVTATNTFGSVTAMSLPIYVRR